MSSEASSWALRVPKSALKKYERAPRPEREQLAAALDALARDPFAGDIVRLTNERSAFRRRVGSWRIFFDADPGARIVEIVDIERRTSTTYRRRWHAPPLSGSPLVLDHE